ncbi:MAG: hypothetical protein HYZ34_02220 [Ignavibacteriae bacterium]|nr:hypothetical protein [Ignavibacteriota bacterium]
MNLTLFQLRTARFSVLDEPSKLLGFFTKRGRLVERQIVLGQSPIP